MNQLVILYEKEILEILKPRFHEMELHGYYGGLFSPDKTRFVGLTYMRLAEIDFVQYEYLFPASSGYGTIGADFDKQKKYLEGGRSYQLKSMGECVREGVYQGYSLCFRGAFFEGEWFIERETVFFGEKMDETSAKSYWKRFYDSPDHWNTGSFATEQDAQLPGVAIIRDIGREEFPGMPELVSRIKIERKEEVNRAFSSYMNIGFVKPFFRRIRINFQEEFCDFVSLFGPDYSLLFPDSKAFFLVVAQIKHQALGYRLVWFFYDTGSAKFYRWTYPQPRYSPRWYHYAEDVIEDIKGISGWDEFRFLNSSRTMDDTRFWSEYVLKKEEDRYRWLKEISC